MTEVTVLTVTVNPAVDHTVWVPGFRAGAVNRVTREERTPGGKGVNVAAGLAVLDVPVTVTGFLGVENAGLFEAFFAATGITDRFRRVEGPTRTGIKVVDDQAGATTDINFPGFTLTDHDVGALEAAVAELTPPGGWVALTGSLPPSAPPDLYLRLVAAVHAAGGQAAVDTSGPPLAAALTGRPDLVKPNRAELEELSGRPLPELDDVQAAAEGLRQQGVGAVVVSLGSDGALFADERGTVVAVPPDVAVISTVGAGDAMVAGLLAARRRQLSPAETAALATACSVATLGVVGPRFDAADVAAAVPTVDVRELAGSPLAGSPPDPTRLPTS